MAKCTKPKCTNTSCGPRGMDGIKKFLLSPLFFSYYLMFFLVFVTIRIFKIPYSSYFCKFSFFVGSLLQFIAAYVVLILTFFLLTLVIKFVKLIIKWIKDLFKKRKNRNLGDRIINFIIRVLIIILLTILTLIFKWIIEKYITMLYFTFGIFMGYTLIGSNNECIQKSK
jgi:hypothetical protein